MSLLRLFAVCAPLLGGCVTGLGEGAGRAGEPPAPLPEFQSTPAVPGMVWIAGAWHWTGTDYAWIPGRWESPPPLSIAPSP